MFWLDKLMDRTDHLTPLTHPPQGKNIHKLSFSYSSMLRELTIIQYNYINCRVSSTL